MLLSLALLIASRTTGGQQSLPPYKNPSLPIETRVADLVSRMTLEEKVSQMMNAAPAIPRLDVPAYDWWNEGLHGVARAGIATVFPQAIGLAATWDTELMHSVAGVISTEARAKYHDAIRKGDHGRYKGLTFWSPNINIFRDPRWGRGQETYGEDPYLTARMGVEFVKGLQGDNAKYLKVIATPKHYAVHSGPESDRHRFDAITDQRDLYETYLPAFEACIREGGAYSVMCAYNRYMGEPCCAHHTLLKKILRDEWQFSGYVVSDCGAVYDFYKFHKVSEGPAAASAVAVKLGTDLECGNDYRSLIEAVKHKLVKEEDIDLSLKRLFTARFKLGMFDPPELVPYSRIPIEENDSAEHRRLALQAARESIVLLKNQNGLLPLSKTLKKIAVIGPTAEDLPVLLGNYNGTPSTYVTPLRGIERKLPGQGRVVYQQGCNLAEAGPIISLVPSNALNSGGEPGLKAEYYANRNLEGAPLTTRIDPTVDSNWINPVPGLEDSNFSIRWTGKLTPTISGRYTLAVTGDDGYRLWVNGSRVIDNWSSHGSETRRAQITLEAGRAYDLKLEYFQGGGGANVRFEWGVPGDRTGNAVRLARESDVVVFVGGISPELEGEEMNVAVEGFRGGDRTSLDLPRVQEELLKAVVATGKPVVLILTSGSALGVNWANEQVASIVQLWYPGEEGGTALADVLFGDYNPAGRLPVTFYKSVAQLPPFDDYRMAKRTYRYFDGEPLFPFGYGLSYTRFGYENLSVPKEIKAGESVSVKIAVTNAGKLAGDEVVQLYVKQLTASVPVAIRSLQGFRRIHLEPGQTETVEFTLTPRQLCLIDNGSRRVVEPGEFEIQCGGGQIGAGVSASQALTARVKVTGDVFVLR